MEKQGKRKPGRPKSKKPKDCRFDYRMDFEQDKTLRRLAFAMKKSRTEILDMGINVLKSHVFPNDGDEDYPAEETLYFDESDDYDDSFDE